MLPQRVGVRASLADVTVLLSGADSWQPEELATKPVIYWSTRIAICAEEKEVEVEMTEAVAQRFKERRKKKKKPGQVGLCKSFICFSVLSLLD